MLFFNYFNNSVESVRETHKENLKKTPFTESYNLSKGERKKIGLPPNKYFEQMWELSMDPVEGRPLTEKLFELQKELREIRVSSERTSSVPGESIAMKWNERGPNNVAGRTKGMMFDPNDSTDETVFAGGVSGGLFKNTKISDPESKWELVANAVPNNISVTCIVFDPNNTKIFYIGTGESYTGAGPGNGLWKSIDGGVNWENIFGGFSGDKKVLYINDVVVRDLGDSSEIYLASSYGYNDNTKPNNNPSQWLGSSDYGLYRSTDGSNFTRVSVKIQGSNTLHQPMDLEIAPDNKVWMSTTNKYSGSGGGTILVSNDEGTAFEKKYQIPNGKRAELEIASDGTIYALAGANPVTIIKSTDKFATTPITILLPNDKDSGITSTDFTRGQSFYDLMIETDPSNNVYVGGIDVFKANAGAENEDKSNPWTQLSHWYGGYGFQFTHADQHGLVFGNNDPKKKIFGNDGGVYYGLTQENGSEVISSRNKNLNTTQFYTIGVAPSEMFKDITKTYKGLDISTHTWSSPKLEINGMTDVFLAGAQDNGTQILANNNDAISEGHMNPNGGDGAASMFSQDPSKPYFIYNYVYNDIVSAYDFSSGKKYQINKESNSPGDFINVQALDSENGILYSNYSSGSKYEIAAYYDWDDFSSGEENTNAPKRILTNALLTDKVSAMSVSPFDSSLMVGLVDGSVLKIVLYEDGKSEFTDISGATFVGSVSDVEFGKTKNDLLVTFHNYGVENIFYSSNEGTSWSKKEGNLPNLPVRCILQNPLIRSEVIIGTDLGIWYSKNFDQESPTWAQANNGMSEVRVTDLDMRDDFAVFASTYGRGVFSGEFSSADPLVYLKAPIPSSLNVKQGKSVSFKVKYLVYGGYDIETEFEVTGLPSGSTIDHTPSKKFTINKSGEITFKLNITDAAEVKTYPLVISATGESTTISPVGINLNVQLNDEGPKLNLSSSISSLEVIQGAKKTFKVAYKASGGYDAETTFALTGLPSGVSSTSTPSDPKINISANGEISYELTVGASVEAKTYPLQVKATATGQTITPLNISLKVTLDDLDSDGIKDADDNCPNTANPNQEDFDGDNIGDVCDPNPIPIETFSLKASDETCRSSDNGSVKVTIKGEFSSTFTVAVTGGPTGFTHTPAPITGSDWSLTKLKTGVYKVCLTNEAFPTLKQCYNVSIEEPEDLSVLSSVNREGRRASLNLAGGVKYNIVLNGNLITTYNNNIDLALSAGINTIKVTTNKECQGVYEETIFISENILLSPNPANSTSKLWVGGNDKDINLTLFDITGRVIWTKNDKVPYSRSINVSFSSIKSGLYILKVNSETINKTIKVIRE